MTPTDTKEYAFPLKEPLSSDELGMSLRDYFAAKAMQSMVVSTQVKDFDWAARMSYKMADEMMKARG